MNGWALSSLVQQQQALLHTLFARPGTVRADTAHTALLDQLDTRHPQTARGLAAYRTNGHAMAERSLLAAYPVIAALIGSDSFALLARDLWHQYPPSRGDLAQWGDALPDFVRSNPQLADVPYLGDVAQAEWALHQATGAPDTEPDLSSFASLAQEDPQGLTLTLAPGTLVINSPYPVASLITAHRHEAPGLAAAAQRLREGVGEHALVWRQGLRPRIAPVTPAAAALVRALLGGADLPQALDAACAIESHIERFDFSTWLAAAVTDGLVLGVQCPATTTTTTEPTP